MVPHHQNVGPKMGPFLEPLIRATIRILLAGSKNGSQFRSRFWSHFFTLFGMHFIAFFCTKQAQNFQNTISFWSASQDSLNMLHTWRQRQPPRCVDYELFPTLWRPLQHLAKISTISNPESRSVDGTEFERQACQVFPKSWTKTTRTDKHTKTVASLCGK